MKTRYVYRTLSTLFAIWLGENPIDKTLRQRLLGKRR